MPPDSFNFSAGDINYFSTLASIAATLVGLSFLSLSFFFTGLLDRYQVLSLPVYRFEDDPELCYEFESVEQIPDRNLFDSDPLVIFAAFSVAFSWVLYFLALVLSITAISGTFAQPLVIAPEMLFFLVVLFLSVRVRRAVYLHHLRVYRTGEEIHWPLLERLFLCSYGAAVLSIIVLVIASMLGNGPLGLRLWRAMQWLGVAGHVNTLYVGSLKVVCALAMFVGLYVLNKDMFIFFKAKASDQMRQRWLHEFTSRRYPALQRRVHQIVAGRPADKAVKALWNGGCPPDDFIRPDLHPHTKLRDQSETSYPGVALRPAFAHQWTELLNQRQGVAAWMFDVPGISRWVHKLEQLCDSIGDD